LGEHAVRISGVGGTQQELGKPSGVGLSVAFIWALAAQMATSVFLVLLFGNQGFSTKNSHTGADLVLAVGYLVAMGILVSIGEALRSGRQWSWWVIVVLAGALSLGGLVAIPATIHALSQGDPWSLWAQIILLTLPPFILYRMLQPITRQWYAQVAPDVARARHNAPAWFATIIGSAAVGGFLTAVFERLS
jgi:hypothetical protein